MPNTLAHMGVGCITGRVLFQDADDKWIYIGCVIPDIPWIFQRVISTLCPGINLLDLRLYAIVQASLIFCLLFSVAVSLFFRRPFRIFLLLAFNCLLHLLLDAGQIKWANGVHLLAPFSWKMTGYGVFWPESIVAYLLTGFGLAMVLWYWYPAWRTPVFVLPTSFVRTITGAGLLIAYLVLPLFLLNGPEQADNHYITTLRSRDERPGRSIAFDRCQYNPMTRTIRIFSGETLKVAGLKWPHAVTISIKGQFVTVDQIQVQAFYVHRSFRDESSLLGLALITILWFTAGWKRRITRLRSSG